MIRKVTVAAFLGLILAHPAHAVIVDKDLALFNVSMANLAYTSIINGMRYNSGLPMGTRHTGVLSGYFTDTTYNINFSGQMADQALNLNLGSTLTGTIGSDLSFQMTGSGNYGAKISTVFGEALIPWDPLINNYSTGQIFLVDLDPLEVEGEIGLASWIRKVALDFRIKIKYTSDDPAKEPENTEGDSKTRNSEKNGIINNLITVKGSDNKNNIYINNVSGIPGIPEPDMWVMMIFGFGLIGLQQRGDRLTKSRPA